MVLSRVWPAAAAFWLSLSTIASLNAGPLDNWTVRRTNSADTLTEITYANGTFVAVGFKGAILTSLDGKVWTRRTSAVTDDLHHVAFCRDKFFAFTWGSQLLSSKDGVTWSAIDSYTTGLASVRTILCTNDLFIAATSLGGQYMIQTSTDGIAWTTRFNTATPYLLDVVFAGGMYVAVGGGNIVASADGINWTNVAYPYYPASLFRVTYGQNTFAAVAYFAHSLPSVIMTSTNALDWTMHDPGGYEALIDITYGNGSFVVSGDDGNLLTSEDAVHWTNRISGTVLPVWSVVYGRGTFVAVGSSGLVLQSDHFGPPQLAGRLVPGSNAFEISIESEIGSSLALQSSSDAVNWFDVFNLTNTQTVASFVDSILVDPRHRFYRTISK